MRRQEWICRHARVHVGNLLTPLRFRVTLLSGPTVLPGVAVRVGSEKILHVEAREPEYISIVHVVCMWGVPVGRSKPVRGVVDELRSSITVPCSQNQQLGYGINHSLMQSA